MGLDAVINLVSLAMTACAMDTIFNAPFLPCVTSHNTRVTYTDKNSEPMLTRSNLWLSNSEPLDKLWPVLSLVTHPDNPWFQVLSCTLQQTLTNSKSCHTPALVLGASNNTRGPQESIPTLVFWASTNTQWASGHPPCP